MEVLTSSPPTPPFSSTTPAPIASKTVSPKSSRSLLDRRQTAAKLLHHQSSQSSLSSSSATASPSLLTASGTHAPFLPSPSASLRMSMLAMASSAASAGVVGRGGVTSGQASSLPFVPLTPIMASPRLTPDIGAAAGSVVSVANDAAGAGGKQSEQQQRADYLNRGHAGGSHYPWYGAASTDGAGRASTMSEHSSTRTTSTGLSEMTNVPRQRSGSSGSTSQTGGGISTTTPGARPSREQPTARLPSSSQHKSKSRRGGKSRSASRTRNTSRTRSSSISRTTSPRAIDLGTLPPYQPLPPLSLSPDFRRVEADIAEGLRGMTSLPASSSTTFTSSSNSQPHHASIPAGTSRSQSHLVSEAGRSGGMPADGYPHGTQPRAFDESASRVSYGYSHPARSSSSPPSFSPLSASSSSSVVPFPPGIPASTPYAHDPRDADTDSAQTRDSPKHRRSPTRHRPRPGSTNEDQEAVLDQHARYRRAYSQSDDALHHLYQQHSQLPPVPQTHSHSESQPRMPSRERRQRMFKRSFDSFTSKTGTGNFVDPIDVTVERRLRKKSGMLVDEDVLDGDMDAGCVLGASLSRKGRSRSVKPKMSLTLSMTSERERAGREQSVGSGRGRKMFIVGGDGSDGEGENDNEIFVDAEAELGSDDVEVLENQGERDSRERDERKTARRYHALLELVTTEVGYLQDLRALVSIHLAQLPSLDAPIPSTLSRPSPSTLSISNLGLSRPFPSSRSFLHLPPSSYPQGPGPGPPPSQDTLSPTSATDRHRDAFDGERSRDAEGAAFAASQKDGNGPATSKPNRRPLFSEQDVQLITRNAAELLATHETFVKMLKYALEPLGFNDVLSGGFEAKKKMSSEGKDDVENAVKAVTELFCQQASAFEIYESFCPGHNEATDLIRTVQEQHPVEWDAFEQRCSLRVSHAFDQQGTPSMDSLRGSLKSKRRHSLSSLAMPMTLSPFGAVSSIPVPLSATGPAKSDTLANRHKRKGSGDVPLSSATTPGNSNPQAGRLKFLDYLIKPVQRICKYPLLLDQLKLRRSEADASQLWDEDPVEAAASAMRRVVALVDRASEKRAHAVKSNLIASRLLADCPASPTSPVHVTVDDRRTQLSAEFMQSLGACMLAGALDVVYYQSNGSCRAKYLATFLYVGGYLVLAKVPKGGKAYEAKHWFPLAGFEIVDQEDDEALPYAFHLCSPTAQIHFAASCQLEKTIWMTAIQESLAIMPSAWINEPTINLPTDIRPLVFAAPEDVIGSEWAATPLPTIQSMSELETPAESSNGPAPPTSSPRKIPKTIARAESLIIQQNHDLAKLSRRTSTTSVKAFFAPLTFDSRVTRPSGQIRQQVDNGLHDVLSDTFVAVRSQVLMRDEELFQLRKKPGNVSRSNSALSISGAFSTRRRRDSATLTSRRKSSVDGPPDFQTDPEAAAKATNLMLARRSKSSSAKLKRQRLSLLPSSAPPLPNKMDSDENMPVVERSQSPSPLTRGPSAASSNTNSILPSPVELTMPLPTPGSSYSRSPDSRRVERPKRTTSMVDNFKYFFQSRSTSPTPSYQRSPQVSVINLDVEPETHGGLIQWWRRGSIRRRAQSYPEAVTDESAPVTPAASSDDSSHAELKAITDRDLLTASPTMLSADGRHRHVSFSQNRTTLARRRSLFASTTFASTTRLDQPASLGTSNMPQIYRSKTLKNLFSFQRSPSHSGELSHQPT